jgi:FAD/FMN-containing dehydrogenase
VRWRLVAPPARRVAVLVPLDSIDAVVGLVGEMRTRVPSLEALELLLPEGLAFTCAYLGVPSPVRDAAAYVLAEAVGAHDPTEELAAVVPDDALLADDTATRDRLWRLRETLTEAIAAAGIPHKFDVGVPLARLGEFLERVPQVVAAAAPGARTFQFGHLGDGNVHINVLGPAPDDEAADEAVLRLAAQLGGTISAEHGVGIAKAHFLPLVRGAEEIAAMRAIKAAFDPEGLLNPGVILPAASG